jgi:hypothetical protein
MPKASLAAEIGIPVYQDLNGLHTAREYTASIGFKYGF